MNAQTLSVIPSIPWEIPQTLNKQKGDLNNEAFYYYTITFMLYNFSQCHQMYGHVKRF